jgi:hypothetical protein
MISGIGVHPLSKGGFDRCISKFLDAYTQVYPLRLCNFDSAIKPRLNGGLGRDSSKIFSV